MSSADMEVIKVMTNSSRGVKLGLDQNIMGMIGTILQPLPEIAISSDIPVPIKTSISKKIGSDLVMKWWRKPVLCTNKSDDLKTETS